MSRVASVYLSKAERDRFNKVCEKEGCTPYSLVKKTLMDHIWAYPLDKAAPSENGELKKDLEPQLETSDLENPKMEVGEIEDRVKQILQGEVK